MWDSTCICSFGHNPWIPSNWQPHGWMCAVALYDVWCMMRKRVDHRTTLPPKRVSWAPVGPRLAHFPFPQPKSAKRYGHRPLVTGGCATKVLLGGTAAALTPRGAWRTSPELWTSQVPGPLGGAGALRTADCASWGRARFWSPATPGSTRTPTPPPARLTPRPVPRREGKGVRAPGAPTGSGLPTALRPTLTCVSHGSQHRAGNIAHKRRPKAEEGGAPTV